MKILYFIIAILLITGCSVVTPPTRAARVESAKIVGSGVTQTDFEIGADAILWTPGDVHLTAHIQKGLSETDQISYDLSIAYIPDYELPTLYTTANFDYKITSQNLKDILAFHFGLGAGYTKYGIIVSPHIGFSLGYENQYAVPFLNGFMSFNMPFQTKKIYNSDYEEDYESGEWDFSDHEREYYEFKNTFSFELSAGLKFPKLHFGLGVGFQYLISPEAESDGAGVNASIRILGDF
ncbi:hypothetical protein JXR93_05255 [bacterium]|nr:hypothetical protein [bacterium]